MPNPRSSRDYGRAIFRVSPYLTPRYRADLIAELEQKGRQGELAYRVRGVQEIPGHGNEERRVDLLNEDAWIVWLNLDLLESVKGMTVKRTAIRYPLRVVRYAVDLELELHSFDGVVLRMKSANWGTVNSFSPCEGL